MATKSRKPAPPPGPPAKEVMETFHRPGPFQMRPQAEPNCFNGHVRFRKYRVTVELIEEPAEVLAERLRKLWRECDNSHHYHPLKVAAESIGIKLEPNELGKDRPRK